MKPKEVREKTNDAIKLELEAAHKRMFDLRNQSVTEKVEDTSQFRKLRRDVARMKTILLQRKNEGKSETATAPAAQETKTA